jgi:mercuric ion binding protein
MRVSSLLLALLLVVVAYAASVQTITLDVQNMTCSTCKITVRKALEKVPGVTEAKVDFEKKTVTVGFDPDRTNPAALTKATAEAGFPSTVRK